MIDFAKTFGTNFAKTLPTRSQSELEDKLKEEAALPPPCALEFPRNFHERCKPWRKPEPYEKWLRNFDKKWPNRRKFGHPDPKTWYERYTDDLKIRYEQDKRWRQDLTRRRADILFGSARARDGFSHRPWEGKCESLWCECKSNNRQPFRLNPSEFIRHARKMRPEKPQATVSAFASWLYSLYSNAYGDEDDRERGKASEQAILELRKMAQSSVHDGYLRSIGSEWRLVHNGLHLPGQDGVPWFSIDHLRVNGEALRASPDLIYRHPRLNEVMIVEMKHSFMQIPSNLWPNLWGQLWCYSQLDIARSANRVTVVGEVWGERTYWSGRGKHRRESNTILHLRASERRDPRVPAYDRFFRTLFEIYCRHTGFCEPMKTPVE